MLSSISRYKSITRKIKLIKITPPITVQHNHIYYHRSPLSTTHHHTNPLQSENQTYSILVDALSREGKIEIRNLMKVHV